MRNIYKLFVRVLLICGLLLIVYGCGGNSVEDTISPDIPGSWTMSSTELLAFLKEQGLNAELNTAGGAEAVRYEQTEGKFIKGSVYQFDSNGFASASLYYKTAFSNDSERQAFVEQFEKSISDFLGKPDIISKETDTSLYTVMQKSNQVVSCSFHKDYKNFMGMAIFYNPEHPRTKRVWPDMKAAGYK